MSAFAYVDAAVQMQSFGALRLQGIASQSAATRAFELWIVSSELNGKKRSVT